jgi:hypothetical protein
VCTTRNFAGDDVNEWSALSNSGSSDRNEASRDAMLSIVYAASGLGSVWWMVTTEVREDVSVHGPNPSISH